MKQEQIRRQVMAILEDNSFNWTDTATGGMYLRFGSAGITVQTSGRGEQTLIQISSHVLVNVEGKTARILKMMNELNMNSHFGRWVYYKKSRTVEVEYDLLGDDLQENELMTSLLAIARLADHYDDVLKRDLQGSKAFED